MTKTPANYNVVGHIPGAYLVDFTNDIHDERSDGIAKIKHLVPTRTKIEGLLRKFGVDQNTVIVLTGDDITHSTRAYFTLLYWGLPRHMVKVLNGTIKTWQSAGYSLETTSPPEPPYSNFSVCQFQQNTSMRATLDEMIDVVEGRIQNAVIIDARAKDEYEGTKKSVAYTKDTTKYLEPFEGHIKGAINQDYVSLLKNSDKEGDDGLLSKEELMAIFNNLSIDKSKTVYVYCHTGRRATTQFFILHAILEGYHVKLYDSSWWEWGKMADKAKKGALNADSPWRTDLPTRSEMVTYNVDRLVAGEDIATLESPNSYATRVDLINQEDATSCGAGGGGGGEGGEFPPPGC